MSDERDTFKGNRFDHLYDQIIHEYLEDGELIRAFVLLATIDFTERSIVEDPVGLARDLEKFMLGEGPERKKANVTRIK